MKAFIFLLPIFFALCFASPLEKPTKLEKCSGENPSNAKNPKSKAVEFKIEALATHPLAAIGAIGASSDTKNGKKFTFNYITENGNQKIELDEQLLMDHIRDGTDWALTNGLIMPWKFSCPFCHEKLNMAQLVPFSLFPSPFPRELFQQAMDVQKALNLLYFRAARDFGFLKEMHRDELKTNPSFKEQVDFLESMNRDGIRQPLTLFCQRADYMTHESFAENNVKKVELKQVEVNTGPIGGFGTSSRVTALHRRFLTMLGVDASPSVVPENFTDTMMGQALYRAWLQFGDREAAIIFLHSSRQDPRFIESRQVQHELERISKGQIKCIFLTLSKAINRLKLDPNNFSLILDDKFVVAVALHRYSSATRAELMFSREIVRRSTAIQGTYFLLMAHTKRMQQIFTKSGVVERFFGAPGEAQMVTAIRNVLTKSWSIGQGDEEADEILRKVKMNSERYVMKWNECGAGRRGPDIFFGADILRKLDNMTSAERNNFIIMEKLRPTVVNNHFVRPDTKPLLNVEVTPELGVFGCLLGNMVDGTVLQHFGNASQMKTKLASEDEGGIWNGKSVYDSPYLV
uniref:Glutathione synthetase n=1 Tax=Globodera rostochiensis TaxID=31243 RepID=A0A914H0A9_GLORO